MANGWRGHFDAVTTNWNHEYWFFKGATCVRTNNAGTEITDGPMAISDGWTVLRETEFAQDLDAVHRSDGYWFFKGDRCCKVNDAGDTYLTPIQPITNQWTVLNHL